MSVCRHEPLPTPASIPTLPVPIGGPFGTKTQSLTVSEIFDGECDAMVDMTLNDL